ncbi:MAG: hypothetical protein JXB49_37175 [Bacteroidales bacterium]|nr:hypothetical protein [Bacteroidales bacterium]
MKIKKTLILVFIILLLPNCNKSEQAVIKEFENVMGETETQYLNEIVEDFELYLEANYGDKDIESKYTFFLNDLSKNELNENWQFDSLKFLKYKNSNLFAKYDTVYADTAWYSANMINYMWENDDLIQAEIIISKRDRPLNIDSLIQDIKSTPFLRQVSECGFYAAIDSVSACDSLVNIINEFKHMGGNDLRFRIANKIFQFNPDYSDYFVKRIVAIETADFE